MPKGWNVFGWPRQPQGQGLPGAQVPLDSKVFDAAPGPARDGDASLVIAGHAELVIVPESVELVTSSVAEASLLRCKAEEDANRLRKNLFFPWSTAKKHSILPAM